jgi:hypothetical protein
MLRVVWVKPAIEAVKAYGKTKAALILFVSVCAVVKCFFFVVKVKLPAKSEKNVDKILL